MEIHKDPVWSQVARVWHIRERTAVEGKQAFTPRLIQELTVFRSPILVVGGGAGLIPIHLARMGHQVTSVDSCAEMTRLARDRAEVEGVSLEILHCLGSQVTEDERFRTVLLNTGVVTQSTLRSAETDATLARSHANLRSGGRVVLAYCLETESNCDYRALYAELGLNRTPSNNRLFLGTDALDEVAARFRAAPGLDAHRVEATLRDCATLFAEQHRMMRSLEIELRRQGVDPAPFVATQFGFEKPYLCQDEEKLLIDMVGARFDDLECKLLSDDETSVISASV